MSCHSPIIRKLSKPSSQAQLPILSHHFRFDFKGVIDYVFYSKNHMTVLGLLGPLDSEWYGLHLANFVAKFILTIVYDRLRENKVAGCPHQYIPSDHFPLLVEFEMTPPSLSHMSNGIALRR